ncbi:MAG: (Fe-S)-binding protein [Methanocellales archaeon]|nr:(Fe-S)-binding protein [Methanocellales archaeon]MDD3292055.1 (Fe-S)-binding protein [Methanocellales archaeon]MDD5235564.1 (Fe-S)-binding protein [Methanocellales archaeon]MDD5485588.1 (Fe-S)-binding protein [Methanocellales archaeon]
MPPNIAIFAVIFVASVALFGWSCFRRFRLVTLGKADNRFSNIGKRIGNMLYQAFAQRCTVSHGYRFGLNHLVLFWCFMILLIETTEFLFNGVFPDHIDLSLLPAGLYHALSFIFDWVSLFALLAVCAAVIRRLAFPPSYIVARSLEAFVILGVIAILMITFFGMNASEIAQGGVEAARYMPISSLVASIFFMDVSAGSLVGYANFFWWIQAIAMLSLLNYLPYSDHMHVLTAIPNCFFKSLTKVNTQSREEFKESNIFGVGRVDQFTWKDLFDSYSCSECGRCTDCCPANFTSKPLNPQRVIHDIKVNLLKNGPLMLRNKDPILPLISDGQEQDGSISEEVIWECTTCGACMEVCPLAIEHVPKIVDMRRHLVEMKAEFPEELLAFFENMEQRSNPWGIAPGERIKWATDIDAKPFEAGTTEYLFYVGCAGAFDARNRRTTLAVAKILDAAGISWGILGKDEMCCGDSLRRLGNEFVFDRIARENIKMFAERGVKKIITQCPHCYSTLKNDYLQYGAELEVSHHTELINNLLKEGKLELNRTNDLGKAVFHDSCYLGRYNNIYEAPRKVFASATGQIPTEMERHHDKSFCCGAGGGRMWMEEAIGKHINVARVEEALNEDLETICVCCPYCMTMFEDGLKDKDAVDRVQVLDLAEIVARALKKD